MGLNAADVVGAPRFRAPHVPDVPAPDSPRSDRGLGGITDRPRREDARRVRATRSRREEKDAEGAARGAAASDEDDIGTDASVRRENAARRASTGTETKRARAGVRRATRGRAGKVIHRVDRWARQTRVGASSTSRVVSPVRIAVSVASYPKTRDTLEVDI